jgi:hypothetical protein
MKAIAIRPPSRKIHFGPPTQLINTPYMPYDASPRPLTPEGTYINATTAIEGHTWRTISETAMKAIAIRPPSRKIHFGRPTQLINTPYMRYDATPRPLTPEGNDG